MNPKKPNSANRKIAKVYAYKLNKTLTVKIPGESHNLQVHSVVLLRQCKAKDLIGVNHSCIRSKFDLLPVNNRKSSCSVYGIKRIKQTL
jgi:small subunit ribosomal protein S12